MHIDVNTKNDYNTCMKKMQYTIRGITEKMDSMVREQSQKYDTSLNSFLLETLTRGLGAGDDLTLSHDMDDLAGTWVEDDEFDRALAAFEIVDEDLWG